jgi:hypothetical protein
LDAATAALLVQSRLGRRLLPDAPALEAHSSAGDRLDAHTAALHPATAALDVHVATLLEWLAAFEAHAPALDAHSAPGARLLAKRAAFEAQRAAFELHAAGLDANSAALDAHCATLSAAALLASAPSIVGDANAEIWNSDPAKPSVARPVALLSSIVSEKVVVFDPMVMADSVSPDVPNRMRSSGTLVHRTRSPCCAFAYKYAFEVAMLREPMLIHLA